MKEIKFRGKSLMPTVDLNYLNIEHDNGWVFGTYIDGYIINDVIEANDEYITIGNWVPVDNVGQYTGIKDKNGVEIFEGDVLFHPLQGRRKVFYPYSETVASYGLRDIDNGFGSTLQDSHAVWEVIGNIYENNYLLEEQK